MPLIETMARSPVVPAISGFLRWWIGELSGIAGAWSRTATPAARVSIVLEPDHVAVERVSGDKGERFIDEQPFDALDETAFAELIGLAGDADTRLCLTPPEIFVTTLSLPKAARSRIDAAIALQMGEIAPLRPELLTWVVTDRQSNEAGIELRIALAKRARLTALRERFEGQGAAPPPIYALDGERSAPFPEAAGRGFRLPDMSRHRLTMISLILLVSIPLTTLAGSAILTARARWKAEALSEQVREVRRAQRKATQMEERRHSLSPLVGQPGAAAILNDLAKRLPSGDWLRAIERKPDGSLLVTVVTQDEAALDKILRDSPLMPGAQVSDRTDNGDGSADVSYVIDKP